MTEAMKKFSVNVLTAEELLENKGLKYYTWDEYEKSVKTLPKTGMKQFEPNHSWLQNMQLEKGITTCKNLIAVERVDRISQLASAEWLPTQKKAKVKKYSGQDWSSFGLEKNSTLYLIPEEALFLLETNCLELTWNDVPLSIQQAYDLLIDNIECTLEEYRVYSQLVRHGYHIQRFVYNSEKYTKYDDVNTKRRIIIEPENGLWMIDNQKQKEYTDTSNRRSINYLEKTNTNMINSSIKEFQNVIDHNHIINDVHEILSNLLNAVENIEVQPNSIESGSTIENCIKLKSNLETMNVNENKKRKKKAEIISDETLLGSIRIVKELESNHIKEDKISSNWQASRIQRNVKLLPKRMDKVSLISDVSINNSSAKNLEYYSRKHKSSSLNENSQIKRSKQEIIELSDDEIQEVPKAMTRSDLLNLIPNIAFKSTITVKISRGYIPHSIKPHKTVYHYETVKLRNLQQTDKKLQSIQNVEYSNINPKILQCYNSSMDNNDKRNTLNQNLTRIQNVFMHDYFSIQQGQQINFDSSYVGTNRLPYIYNQDSYWHHRNTVFQNMFVAMENHSTALHQNRFISVQMNNFLVPNISNNTIRNSVTQNQLHHHFYQNFLPLQKLYHQKIIENMSIHCNTNRHISLLEPRQRYWSRNSQRGSHIVAKYNKEVYQSSFKVLSGASSWSELKTKWHEEKTITIEDEDTEKDNEIQVIKQIRSPLIGPKNANNLEEVFSKLQIIKPAPEKTIRRKKSKYKISYNVYSNTHNYKKANPGPPLYRVVVIRQDDPFIQPIEVHRLLQDANNSPIVLACVSMSISYVQPAFIFVHNLTQIQCNV